MKFTLKDICIVYNKHINSIYPKLKPIMPLFLFNSGKKCKRIFTEQEITALLPYLKKPKKAFIINNIDNNIIFLATILNNKIQH
jgi:hypothetical protein